MPIGASAEKRKAGRLPLLYVYYFHGFFYGFFHGFYYHVFSYMILLTLFFFNSNHAVFFSSEIGTLKSFSFNSLLIVEKAPTTEGINTRITVIRPSTAIYEPL